MKNCSCLIFIFLMLAMLPCVMPFCEKITFAEDGDIAEYVVYNQQGEEVARKSEIEEGDVFITSNFDEYEIYKVEGNCGYARKKRDINPPKINRQFFPQKRGIERKSICMYMTHNDESYTPSDGYDSIYGAGGIHDVARELQEEFNSRGIFSVLDETLHIPHNSSAYSRSSVTAKSLKENYFPDALFDIHRDGISKSYYYTNQNGLPLSKVRIVVGKSNPNFEENYQFAQKVFALGASMYPWLFLDVYCGGGHYNQSLKETNLLFEMGTYMIEKEYVFNTVPYLADVVETALYNSVSNGDDEIIVDDEKSPETEDIIIDEENNESQSSEPSTKYSSTSNWVWAMIFSFAFVGTLVIAGVQLYKKS